MLDPGADELVAAALEPSLAVPINRLMRLWSIHPRYLDTRGFVALWREALLAKAVLRGQTQGYRYHPQLVRFRARAPVLSINTYLRHLHEEALSRQYSFDATKIGRAGIGLCIPVTEGQVSFEWDHLLAKLAVRNPELYRRWREVAPECHPLFCVVAGPVEAWERAAGPNTSYPGDAP